MILEIINANIVVAALGPQNLILDEIIEWGENISKTTPNAVISVLYCKRLQNGVVLQLYLQTNANKWFETTREMSESELPFELKDMQVGSQIQVAKWSF